MSRREFLVLGGGDGWHSSQLRAAARKLACDIAFATYESLAACVGTGTQCEVRCQAGPLSKFDAILPRTMPTGSLEQITFRLATLHSLDRPPLVNSPRALEIAIDKFATLAHVAQLGYAVPKTMVVQSRAEAIAAFDELGQDCIVKPIFGGEGRGVMRISDPQLAWYTFSTLESLDAVGYVQEFVAPGGIDTRLLVVGDQVFGVRRRNENDFRTNVSSGARCEAVKPSRQQVELARHIVHSIGLSFASVDLIDADDGSPRVLEINLGIYRHLLSEDRLPATISERAYSVACRESTSRQECVDMVHLATGLGETLKRLVKVPLLGAMLRAMRGPAHAAGFAALHDFLEGGYTRFRAIPDIDLFLNEIDTRMTGFFDGIFTSTLDELDATR